MTSYVSELILFSTESEFVNLKEPRNRFPAWRAGTASLFIVLARQAT